MGHSQEEKARTHERIVETASRRLRERGIEGIGVADLMKEAGVTAGGFYKHFTSRDELVTEAIRASFGNWARRIEHGRKTGAPVGFGDLVREYLSPAHRDDPATGCPMAALAPDLARSSPETRAVATESLGRAIELLASLLGKSPRARAQAILAYAAMVGAVSLARLATDPELSSEILGTVRSEIERRT